MIKSFQDKRTEKIANRIPVRRLDNMLLERIRIKLILINNAKALDDLKIPPGNRLEALRGNRAGQFSIRVNSQWRICFRWDDGNAYDVEFTDYH